MPSLTTSWCARRERNLVLALQLAEQCLARYGMQSGDPVEAELPKESFKGRVLEHLRVAHPFQAYDVPVILGDHVTADAGTGAVHTAPAHGQEDFAIGRRYNLPVPNPTGNDGRFLPDTPLVGGMKLEEGGKLIVETMRANGTLIHEERYVHSYPHCWRHHSPVVFRTTPQWFISMDQKGLRAHALRDIHTVEVDAGLGRAAHQRHGCRSAGLVHFAPAHLGCAVGAVRSQAHGRAASAHPGADRGGGRARSARRYRGLVFARPGELLGADAADYEKLKDVMDVWADSGVSFDFMAATRARLCDARRSVHGRLRPASRLVSKLAADVRGAVRACAVSRGADPRFHRG